MNMVTVMPTSPSISKDKDNTTAFIYVHKYINEFTFNGHNLLFFLWITFLFFFFSWAIHRKELTMNIWYAAPWETSFSAPPVMPCYQQRNSSSARNNFNLDFFFSRWFLTSRRKIQITNKIRPVTQKFHCQICDGCERKKTGRNFFCMCLIVIMSII